METYTIEVKKDGNGQLWIDGQYISSVVYGPVCAVINNGSTGCGHSPFANIDKTGSVKGMKAQGYWHKDDQTAKQGGYIYNTSRVVVSDGLDALALVFTRKQGHMDDLQLEAWQKRKVVVQIDGAGNIQDVVFHKVFVPELEKQKGKF